MKKERMIIAFLSLLFLLPGCKEEKTQSVFDADEFDCVGWPHIRKVTITNVNCEAEGIFLILEDSLVYLKSATKPLNVLIAFTRPLITEFADNLNLKHPLLPTISPYPTM